MLKKLSVSFIIILAIITLVFYLGSRNKKTRVLLIGLDGASWNVITPLLREHKLPNIEKLINNGCSGNLETIWPLFSEVIWTSIATGKIPAAHGITERFVEDKEQNNYVYASRRLRKVKATWDILSDKGYKVGVINYLVTWPPDKLNGVMVSDRITDVRELNYLSKNNSSPVFSKLLPKEEFDRFKTKKEQILSGINIPGIPHFWSEIEGVDNFMFNLSKYLLQKRSFDFFCLYLRGIDVVSHALWKFKFPGNLNIPKYDSQRYGSVLDNYYILCDKMIGDILQASPRDTVTFVVSDHGFTAKPGTHFFFEKVNYLLDISGIKQVHIGNQTVTLTNDPEDKYSFLKVIKITGNTSEIEFNKIREDAKNILKNIQVIETGEHPFSKFKDTRGGFAIDITDIQYCNLGESHVLINEKKYAFKDFITGAGLSGEHSNPAIIIVSGKHILHNKKINLATIYDIFPTVLYCMGLPLPQDIAGRVLFECMDKRHIKNNPAKYINTYETNKNRLSEKPVGQLFNEDKIKEKLRSLGYIN